jgi:hypothetical protein
VRNTNDHPSGLWERFAEPSRAFSPVPLWWWSGDTVTAERLRWQLERLAAGGIFNVVVMNLAPTSPLYGSDADDPPFLSERWWEVFLGMCRDAEELGVRVWFYDQIGFSGANFQGQVVLQDAALAGRWLERVAIDVDGEGTLASPGGGVPLAAAALPLDGEGRAAGPPVAVPLQDGHARFSGSGPHRLMLFYVVTRGFDYFSRDACDRLMEHVHRQFEERTSAYLGSVIVGSFQDELPNVPTWSATFPERFAGVAGYDPVPHLAALWEDLGEDGERFRHDFHAVRGALAEAAFFKPLAAWHEHHGLMLGFDQQYGAREGDPVASQRLYGDYVRTHRWFTVPGSDHHGEAKIHSSMAHHYGHERVWIESFHTSGWGGTLEETFDWLLPWLGAGANLYDPHATYYATRSGWWEWAPPATDWRQPYWRHYDHFARAVARLCSVLAWGEHACEVGVLFPDATARAGLGIDDAFPDAREADRLYRDIVGRMTWFDTRPGALNRLALDFDVLDDDTVAGASVGAGGLSTRAETYRTIVLPGCRVVSAETARRLAEFVDAGGRLVAVGPLPERAAGMAGDDEAVAELRARFASGAAQRVERSDGLEAALEGVVPRVEAPVPTLVRHDKDTTVVFVPAVHPRATRVEVDGDPDHWLSWARGTSYAFDRGRYAERLDVVVRGVEGPPELWEPFSGVRRRVVAEPVDGGMRVSVPFADGPCALLVWGADPAELAAAHSTEEGDAVTVLDGGWDVQVEATLEDDWGDLAAPAHSGVTAVEAWALEHRMESGPDWSPVHATFGPRASWTGPAAPSELPRPGDDAVWRDAVWSPSRGILKDSIHAESLGPSGRVPEEFMDFGPVAAGHAVHVRAVVRAGAALKTHLAVGGAAGKEAWLDGAPVELEGLGHMAAGAVSLPAGDSVLDLRFSAVEAADPLRAHFAFVADLDGYRRPEWLRAAGASSKSALIVFATTLSLAHDAERAGVLLGANGPARLLVDGAEVGRQGGFDPYEENDFDRLQPYDLTERLSAGDHEIRLELLDMGRTRPAAVFDGLVETAHGTVPVRSGEEWRAMRDGKAVGLDLRLTPAYGDPAYAHAWRRPHPLPEGAWLEPGRAVADPGGAVDVRADATVAAQRLRLTLPPGASRLRVPLAPGCRATVEVDGRALAAAEVDRRDAALTDHHGPAATDHENVLIVDLPGGERRPAPCEIAVVPAAGLRGGGLLAGPVRCEVGPGRMELCDWQDAGLEGHSGAVRYRRRIVAAAAGGGLRLDLGEVRGTAELLVDGVRAGVRVCSPYAFDLTGRVKDGGATIEIVVCNTLAPHLDAVSPTPYILPGQKRSGLFGPVTVRG